MSMHSWVFNRKDFYRVFSFLLEQGYPFQETSFSKQFLPVMRQSETLVVGRPIEAVFTVYHYHDGIATFDVCMKKGTRPFRAWLEFCRHMSQYREIITTPRTKAVRDMLIKLGFTQNERGDYVIQGEQLTGRRKKT